MTKDDISALQEAFRALPVPSNVLNAVRTLLEGHVEIAAGRGLGGCLERRAASYNGAVSMARESLATAAAQLWEINHVEHAGSPDEALEARADAAP